MSAYGMLDYVIRNYEKNALPDDTHAEEAQNELDALRARIRTLEGELLYVKTTLEGRDRGSTHWQGCENDPRHWRCYLVKRIAAALDGGVEA